MPIWLKPLVLEVLLRSIIKPLSLLELSVQLRLTLFCVFELALRLVGAASTLLVPL